jgi:hypothetical protein
MQPHQIQKLAQKYRDELVGKWGAKPEKADENMLLDEAEAVVRNHLAWCCTYIVTLLARDPIVAQQWLGFLQAGMWVTGVYTLEELRQHQLEV